MKLKRLLVIAAVGGLTVPTYWHTVSATELGDTQCHDNLDNDGDGRIDYAGGTPPRAPADPDCTGPDDNDESGPLGQPNTTNTSSSSSSANNTNNNTSTNTSQNTNTNTSNSSSSSQSASQSGSSSSSCVLLCDTDLLSDVLSGLGL